jgi:L-aspartate oxidase
VAGKPVEIIADATVLATGGCGQVYRYTTNPQVATGDGYAIAHRAGAKLADMEFVQFHPTALDTAENPLQLISEAVRGEGAVLLNEDGERFMLKKHRLAELAPRDVVAREIFREKVGGRHVWLDARMLGPEFRKRFPGIFAICAARGIDPSRDLIPVKPAAHYMMGGVVVDLRVHTRFNSVYVTGTFRRFATEAQHWSPRKASVR